MPEEHLITSVNKHYLDKVMNLAEECEIKATEDIFDARGTKLVAKGARISQTLHERLIQRRLSKPFESSIAADSGMDARAIALEAQRIVDTVAPVRAMLTSFAGGPSPLQILSEIQFGSATSTMLTVIERGGQTALAHSVMVSLLSVCFAKKLGMDLTAQTSVALAGLLHDIGELYIEPEYLHSSRRLYPHEWRHVVVHPRIGQMLIEELEDYPPMVAQAVFEHHERFDGGGYPRSVSGAAISAAGQVLSVAEMISGVFMHPDKPLERAELALKIVPGEHAHPLVSAVSSAMQSAYGGRESHEGNAATGTELESVRHLYERIIKAMQTAGQMLEQPEFKSSKSKELLSAVARRIGVIQRAFSSTGLDICIDDGNRFFDIQNMRTLFEAAVATREIQWRLRDVARDLALQATMLEAQEADGLRGLITLLDGEH